MNTDGAAVPEGARGVVVLCLAAVLLTACSSPGDRIVPSTTLAPDRPGTAAPRSAPPSLTPVSEPTVSPAPEPSPWPSPDQDALRDAAMTCRESRPRDLFDISGPQVPDDRLPTYATVAVVLVDLRPLEGDLVPAPTEMAESWGYSLPDEESEPGFAEVARPVGPEAELLICVDLRVTDMATYSGGWDLAVADELAWPVDSTTGQRIGAPWMTAAGGFPAYLLADADTWSTGLGYGLLGVGRGSIAQGVRVLLDRVRPVAGVYQGGTHHGYTNPEPDAHFLVEGTDMSDGETFVVRLVFIEEASATIDFVEVFCAPDVPIQGNTIRLPPIRLGTDVAIELGRFSARSSDVRLEGYLTDDQRAEGSIRGLTGRARDCGIPDDATWRASAEHELAGDDAVFPLRRLLATRVGNDYTVALEEREGE